MMNTEIHVLKKSLTTHAKSQTLAPPINRINSQVNGENKEHVTVVDNIIF